MMGTMSKITVELTVSYRQYEIYFLTEVYHCMFMGRNHGQFKVPSQHLMEGTEENYKRTVRTANH
jgi:hypothetical protein